MPAETHWHYDAEDNLIGRTVVERESRIDDADRLDLLGLMQYEAEVCRCGFHPSVANDTTNNFQAGSRVCPVCAGIDVWERILHDRDEKWSKANKDASPTQERPSDGRAAFMRMLTPEQAESAAERKAD